MFEKEYVPEYQPGCVREKDPNTGLFVYFKKIPISVTNEEYQKLRELFPKKPQESKPNNMIQSDFVDEDNLCSSVMKVISYVIIIIGIIGGVIYGYSDEAALFLSFCFFINFM